VVAWNGGGNYQRVCLDERETAGSEADILSLEEIARASRFHFEKDRLHFSRCRSALRQLLAGYLQIRAADVRFEYLPGGKPRLVAEQNPGSQFNVSHSAGMALIAVGSERELGTGGYKRISVPAECICFGAFLTVKLGPSSCGSIRSAHPVKADSICSRPITAGLDA
jgi:hypothetical protein